MKLLRLIVMIVLGLALITGFIFLAIQPGQIAYTGGPTEVIVKPAAAAALLLVVTSLLVLIWGIIGWLWALPATIKRAHAESARKRGVESLGLALAAFEGGEVSEARRQAQKALGFMPDVSGAKLFSAKAAVAASDSASGERLYGELTDTIGYQVAARRGLAELALARGNASLAISHAEVALQSSKKSPWPAEFLFQRRVLAADWTGALAALDDGEKRGLVGAKIAARRRAVVLTAGAHHAEKMMEMANALDMAQRAVKIAPGFAPAAVMAARLQAIAGKSWQAAGTLETAWEASPHPALALAYKDLKSEEDAATRGRWLDGLIRLNSSHRESRILAIEQALALGDNVGAIVALEPLLAERPTSRILALRAAAAKAAGDESGARDWLGKGANAPREADWSDLDPDGSAFNYEDADWVRLIESYGQRGVLVHPRLERSDSERLAAPELVGLTATATLSGPGYGSLDNPPSADDPGLAVFDGLGVDEEDMGQDKMDKKKSWLTF
jgi:HemY protein